MWRVIKRQENKNENNLNLSLILKKSLNKGDLSLPVSVKAAVLGKYVFCSKCVLDFNKC